MSQANIRTPNEEQKSAIEHSGGVLLSAGAGSGKTFVLVEHIIYLLKDFKKSIKAIEDTETAIRKYLSSIVLMTFTKKAAGEMANRLHKRVQSEQLRTKEDSFYWELVSKSLGYLYVGTIHGYCYKLISANFFPELRTSFDIIDADSQKTKIEDLFDEWFLETKKNRVDFMNRIILTHRKQILSSVFEIFGNPDLRAFWNSTNIEGLGQMDLNATMSELLDEESWGHVVSGRFDLSGYEGNSKLAWYKNVNTFLEHMKLKDWESVEYWERLLDFFKTVRWSKTPKKNSSIEVDDFIDDIKKFAEFVKKDGTSILEFLKNKDIFNSWLSDFYSLFSYIENRYEKLGGLTFSDLEYYVLKGLQGKPWAVKKISEQYKYFIVDEFQDTSEVQYEILKYLIDGDFKRLFCVGDLKQAIYGFRGGELGVFLAASNEIPINLSLSKNYRSEEKIIHLNNTLFDYLFKFGVNYSGVEKNPVEVEFQTYPGSRPGDGEVKKINYLVESEIKPTSRDMDILESEALFESIIKRSAEEGTIGILYKNLGASSHLIPKLVNYGLSFTAQVKIPMEEGPMWALFSTLLEGHLDQQRDKPIDQISFLVHGILSWIGSTREIEIIKNHIKQFYQNTGPLGFMASFEVFVNDIGLCDADYQKNFSKIAHLNELAGEDPEKLFNLMNQFGPDKISVEFRFGDNPESIFLMTAHGSKGLEFDHVFIGGIHTNGRKFSSSPLLGKFPGSLKWKLDATQKDYFKSPIYLMEERKTRKKDFSESKRLFYVACTRAQKTLTYVDLNREGAGLKYSEDSWINGFRLYEEFGDKENSFNRGHISIHEMGNHFEGRELRDDIKPPLFQQDNLGIIFKEKQQAQLGLLAEVSVTRLATLAQCSRKFYLSNICKLDENDLERLGFGNDLKINDEKNYKEPVEDISPVYNSRERGILVHDALSRAIKANLICPLDVSKKDVPAVEYVLDLLKKKNSYSFLSEVPVKFPLFGQMISGTPDLILIPEDKTQVTEVWDFKTGTQKENSELAYWFQLYCYGIQTCLEQGLSDDDQVIVALVYVDEKKFVKKTLSKKEIQANIFLEWRKLADFNQVNLDHCSSCSFGNLCQLSP